MPPGKKTAIINPLASQANPEKPARHPANPQLLFACREEVIFLLDTRDRLKPPFCPFCRQRIEPPVEVDGLWFEFDGGVCSCGAHYCFDPTARNGGAVLMQAVVQACDGDWDRAITLSPGTDFEEGFLGQYNALNHRVGGNAFGTLYFVRLKAPENPGPQ